MKKLIGMAAVIGIEGPPSACCTVQPWRRRGIEEGLK